jgi:hypothetical protein
MNIDDLLRFRNMLSEKLTEINELNLLGSLEKINTLLTITKTKNQMALSPEFIEGWREYTNIISLVKQADIKLVESLVQIDQKVKALAVTRFPDIGEFQNRYTQNSRHIALNEETLKTIRSRIFINANFQYPVLQFGCNSIVEQLTKDLVANDPLYLCDFNSEQIEYVSSQFNSLFNQRIRKYVITDSNFSALPQGQFGLMLSWMVFNYADLSAIERYLEKMMLLLRPGGVHIFSYNNCEFLESYQLADKGWMSYVTKTDVFAICNKLGYEIVNSYDVEHARYEYERISWIEIKKPGELKSAKRKQVTGKIKAK